MLKRLWEYLKARFFGLYGMRDTQADHDKPRTSIKQDRSARRRIARKRRQLTDPSAAAQRPIRGRLIG